MVQFSGYLAFQLRTSQKVAMRLPRHCLPSVARLIGVVVLLVMQRIKVKINGSETGAVVKIGVGFWRTNRRRAHTVLGHH